MHIDDIVALGVFLFLCLIAVGAFLVSSSRRHRTARHRLDVLRDSLDRPDLDVESRRSVLQAITDDQEARRWQFLRRPGFWRGACFAVGWLLFLLFGGITAAAGLGMVNGYILETSLPGALFGLALMTMPIALREIHRGSGSGGGTSATKAADRA